MTKEAKSTRGRAQNAFPLFVYRVIDEPPHLVFLRHLLRLKNGPYLYNSKIHHVHLKNRQKHTLRWTIDKSSIKHHWWQVGTYLFGQNFEGHLKA